MSLTLPLREGGSRTEQSEGLERVGSQRPPPQTSTTARLTLPRGEGRKPSPNEPADALARGVRFVPPPRGGCASFALPLCPDRGHT